MVRFIEATVRFPVPFDDDGNELSLDDIENELFELLTPFEDSYVVTLVKRESND